MATEQLVNEIREICTTCTSTDIDKLVSNPDWGKLNFETGRSDLQRAFSIFNDLLVLPIDILPDQVITKVIQTGKPLQDTILSIQSFDITTGGDSVQNRDTIVATLKKQVDSFYIDTQQWIPYLLYQKGDIQRNISDLTEAVKNAHGMVESTKTDIETKKGEIDGIIVAAREASASAGVAHFTADFSSEAEKLQDNAKNWLIATGILGGITLVSSIGFLFLTLQPNSSYATVQIITTKLIILGLLFTGTLWCGRIYKALMHQVTVNRHRANSIKTFQAFNQAASNDASRDAVLMETTKAIFGQGTTGYLDKESGSSGDQLRIVEMVKHVPKVVSSDSSKPS
jgi:hypothetical protein